MIHKADFGAKFEVVDNRKNISANALVHSIWDVEVIRSAEHDKYGV